MLADASAAGSTRTDVSATPGNQSLRGNTQNSSLASSFALAGTIAVAEPTPFGEIALGVAVVGVGAYTLVDKMATEIKGITERKDLGPQGEVYSLRATRTSSSMVNFLRVTEFSGKHLASGMPAVFGVNNALKTCFADTEYGSDLIYIAIGLILVDSSEVAKRFHPVRPFKYKHLDRVKHPGTGQVMEFHNSASWDVKPDFATFSGLSLDSARDYLCETLIASTAVLEEHCSEYPDFDVAQFRADFEACLREHCSE